jgi:hypothetical protein
MYMGCALQGNQQVTKGIPDSILDAKHSPLNSISFNALNGHQAGKNPGMTIHMSPLTGGTTVKHSRISPMGDAFKFPNIQ